MHPSRRRQLDELVQISRDMLVLARDSRWEPLLTMEQQRRQAVEAFFSKPVNASESADVEKAIREILAMNLELTELGQDSRRRMGDDIHRHSVGRVAEAAYHDCSGC